MVLLLCLLGLGYWLPVDQALALMQEPARQSNRLADHALLGLKDLKAPLRRLCAANRSYCSGQINA